jgi:hypothetical protein
MFKNCLQIENKHNNHNAEYKPWVVKYAEGKKYFGDRK